MSFPLNGRASMAEIIQSLNQLADEPAVQTSMGVVASGATISPLSTEDPVRQIAVIEGAGDWNATIGAGFLPGSQILIKENTGVDREMTINGGTDTIEGQASLVIQKGWAAVLLHKVESDISVDEWVTVGFHRAAISKIDDFLEMKNTVEEDKTIENANALSVGPLTVADGVTVTVADGFRWVVV